MHIFVTNTKQFKIINNDAKKHLGTVKTVKCVVCDNIPWKVIDIVAEKIYQTRKKRGARIWREERHFSRGNQRKMIHFHTLPDIGGIRFTIHFNEDGSRMSIFLSTRR